MADVDKSSKTEPPSEKKLNEAYSKGSFAKAPEIAMTATLLAGLIVIAFWGPSKALELSTFTKAIFENLDTLVAKQEGTAELLKQSYLIMAIIVLPMLVACFLAAVAAEGVQTGFRFTPKAIEPSFNKMNPVNGVKRVFGLKALKAFLVDFLKFISIATVVWLTITFFLSDPIFYAPVPVHHIPEFIHLLMVVMFTLLFLMLLIVAIINFIIKKREFTEEMKMTKQEVKEERKSKEVAPEVKAAQRRKAIEIVMGQNLQDVSTADVVVTNPTHYAVALKYEKGTDHAPIVVAKGENQLARKIKAIAKEYDVPTVEDKAVARMLFAIGVVGEAIPLQLYRVVAQILAHVYQAHSYYFHRLKARRLLAKRSTSKSFA
jgi:flagellar biosynthetic protein FlhB